MNKSYQLGLEINKVKDKVLGVLTEDLYEIAGNKLRNMDIDEFAIKQYAQLDVNKLFLALISNKPDIFKAYISWQIDVFSRGDVKTEAIRDHINVLRGTLENYISEDLHPVLDEYISIGLEAITEKSPHEESFLAGDNVDKDRAEKYMNYLLDKKQLEATHYLSGMVYNKIKSVKNIYKHILVPVQYEIGRLWQKGKITVADEHYASETTKNIISVLRNYYPEKTIRGNVLTAALGGEMHDIGIRVVNEFLKIEGYNVYYLGINTPISSLVEFIQRFPVDVLAVSVTNPNYVWWSKEMIDEIKFRRKMAVKIIVGGLAFDEPENLWKEIGADGYGKDADSAVRMVNAFNQAGQLAS